MTQICSIPIDDAPWGWCDPASEDYNIMSLSVKISGEARCQLVRYHLEERSEDGIN